MPLAANIPFFAVIGKKYASFYFPPRFRLPVVGGYMKVLLLLRPFPFLYFVQQENHFVQSFEFFSAFAFHFLFLFVSLPLCRNLGKKHYEK